MRVAGIVLAGGLSRRMGGREKSLIRLAGKSLVAHASERLRPQVSGLAINANGDPSRFDFLNCPIVADPIDGFAGPLAGVLAGLQWASSKCEEITHVVSVAADTPFFPADLVERFRDALSGTPSDTIALAQTAGRVHPVFGLWPVSLAGSLEEFLTAGQTRKVLAFVDQHGCLNVTFDSPGVTQEPFFNVNTPDDLEKAEQHFDGPGA